MTEVNSKTFRSNSKRVYDSDDMIRVTLDLSINDYHSLIKPLIKGQDRIKILDIDPLEYSRICQKEGISPMTAGLVWNLFFNQ